MSEDPQRERIAIFVDAGYLFKQGGLAISGRKPGRHELGFDPGGFCSMLHEWVHTRVPGGVRRTYWYDGARFGSPSPEQHTVAALPFVKLRLGRVNAAGQQKGVDTLIVRDLMVLSQERSIDRAVVLAGDEDLREGIEYAQDRGVLVTVVGIADERGNTSQSIELRREADEALALGSTDLGALTVLAPTPATGTPPGVHRPAGRETGTPASVAADIPGPDVATVAEAIAAGIVNELTDTDRAAVTATKPGLLPRHLDGRVLHRASRQLAPTTTLTDPIKRELRRLVRTALDREISAPS